VDRENGGGGHFGGFAASITTMKPYTVGVKNEKRTEGVHLNYRSSAGPRHRYESAFGTGGRPRTKKKSRFVFRERQTADLGRKGGKRKREQLTREANWGSMTPRGP